MGLQDYAALAQAGGLLAFSWVVWQELKTQRVERANSEASNRKILNKISEDFNKLRNALLTSMPSSQRKRTIEILVQQDEKDD